MGNGEKFFFYERIIDKCSRYFYDEGRSLGYLRENFRYGGFRYGFFRFEGIYGCY